MLFNTVTLISSKNASPILFSSVCTTEFLHNNKSNINRNKINVERNAKRKPTKWQPCLEHSAKTYNNAIINVSNWSAHGRRNLVAPGARAPTCSQICMKSSLFSVNIALLHVKLPHNACALTFLMLPTSLAPLVFLVKLGGSFYSKCAKFYALRNPALTT